MTTALQTQTKQRPWWLTLISGILALIVGAILLWAPAKNKVETGHDFPGLLDKLKDLDSELYLQ
jgi:ABC-type nickel/cobalt efflux system permease component RcnA